MKIISLIFIFLLLSLSLFGSLTVIAQSQNGMLVSCFASLANFMKCTANPGELGYVFFHTTALKSFTQSLQAQFYGLFYLLISLFILVSVSVLNLKKIKLSFVLFSIFNKRPIVVPIVLNERRWLSRHKKSPTN